MRARPGPKRCKCGFCARCRQREREIEPYQHLELQPPGPFRSLGGYLNYENWEDRERFQYLDKHIADHWSEHDPHGAETERAIALDEQVHALTRQGWKRGPIAASLAVPVDFVARSLARMPAAGD